MNSIIITKNYEEPPFCEKEILRYAGCKNADDTMLNLMRSCIAEVKNKLSYNVCCREIGTSIKGDLCDFGYFSVKSENLGKNLKDCKRIFVFAATIGTEIDRIIGKYSRISPSKAIMFQAIGSERVEALCDTFCEDLKSETKLALKPRFSPGYGDLSLSVQKDIVSVLDCFKRIGIALNDSLLMSPSKSVTAFVGLSEERKKNTNNKCTNCNKYDCAFRGAI